MKNKLWQIFSLLFIFVECTFAQENRDLTNFWLSPLGLMPVKQEHNLSQPSTLPLRKNKLIPIILNIPNNDDITLLNDGYFQSENSVFLDPNDNTVSTAFKAINSNNTASSNPTVAIGSNFLRTTNGGQSWNSNFPHSVPFDNAGDPSVVIDLDGNQYVSYMLGSYSGLQQWLVRSSDNGSTFTEFRIDRGATDNDKSHLWVDNSRNSPYQGTLYSAFTEFIPGVRYGQVIFAKSTDQGENWSLYHVSGQYQLSPLNHGVNIQTGPNGEVYFCWALYDDFVKGAIVNESGIGFSRSLDGGYNFSVPEKKFSILGHRATPLGGGKNMRHFSYPSMSVSQQNGDIYIAVTERISTSNNETDIFLYKSNDGGSTFPISLRRRINQDATSNGKDQWSPWIACDPISGLLVCVFYDSRDFTNNDAANTYVALSYDGGNSWLDGKVSNASWNAKGFITMGTEHYAGDYIGVATRYCQCIPVWSDSRSGAQLTYTSPFNVECPANLILCNARIREEAMHSVTDKITVAGSSCTYIVDNNGTSDGGRCIMEAGNEIQIGDGFNAKYGSFFRASIASNCTQYCRKVNEFIRSSPHYQDEAAKKGAETGKFTEFKRQATEIIEINVIPNPASDKAIIQYQVPASEGEIKFQIFSLFGEKIGEEVCHKNISGSQYIIEQDVSQFSTGIYWVVVRGSYQQSISKLSILH